MNLSPQELQALVARTNSGQAGNEGYNRVCCFLNGEKYIPPASLSALPVQPAPRVVKSLAQCLDDEHVDGLSKVPTQTALPGESSESPALLSATEAAGRKVPTLAQLLNAEADASGDEYSPSHQFRINMRHAVVLE